jgi:hypothetical protein
MTMKKAADAEQDNRCSWLAMYYVMPEETVILWDKNGDSCRITPDMLFPLTQCDPSHASRNKKDRIEQIDFAIQLLMLERNRIKDVSQTAKGRECELFHSTT